MTIDQAKDQEKVCPCMRELTNFHGQYVYMNFWLCLQQEAIGKKLRFAEQVTIRENVR